MISLYGYLGKRVKIIDDNGKEWHGYVDLYTSDLDNETDGIAEESIVIKTDDQVYRVHAARSEIHRGRKIKAVRG